MDTAELARRIYAAAHDINVENVVEDDDEHVAVIQAILDETVSEEFPAELTRFATSYRFKMYGHTFLITKQAVSYVGRPFTIDDNKWAVIWAKQPDIMLSNGKFEYKTYTAYDTPGAALNGLRRLREDGLEYMGGRADG